MSDILNVPTTNWNGSPIFDGTPAMIVPKVINAAWNLGNVKQAEFAAKVSAATSGFLDVANAPSVSAGTVSVPSITEPTVDIPTSQSGGDWQSYFDSKYLELAAWLSTKFTDFRATYFPDENAAYTAAEDALQAMLANPASYLPANVQAQFFGDDQARILADKVRAQDAVVAQFAGRRFPLPPDVAANLQLQIEQKAQDQLAESSRKVAMLSVEQFKFVVEKTLSLRQVAMNSAVEYIKALASGPDMASKLVTVGYDAQSKLISSAADFYRARIQAADTVSKVHQYNNSTALEAGVKNQAAELTIIEDKLKAMLSEAQSLAQMATSLFNNVQVSAGLSGSYGNSVSYNYQNDTQSAGPTIGAVG